MDRPLEMTTISMEITTLLLEIPIRLKVEATLSMEVETPSLAQPQELMPAPTVFALLPLLLLNLSATNATAVVLNPPAALAALFLIPVTQAVVQSPPAEPAPLSQSAVQPASLPNPLPAALAQLPPLLPVPTANTDYRLNFT